MKLLLFSDLHLRADRRMKGRDPVESFRAALAHALAHHGNADLAVLLGDLVDSGSAEEYRLLADSLRGFALPWQALIGNHDDRAAFRAAFGGGASDPVQAVRDVDGYRLVFLDSHVPGRSGGSLSDGRLDWLAATLAAADRPCLVFLHHPPVPVGLPAFDAIGLKDPAAFATVIRTHREKVRQIIFGHCHMPITALVAGVPAVGIGSTAYKALPILNEARFADAPGLPPVYAVVLGDVGGGLVSHVIEYGYRGAVISHPA